MEQLLSLFESNLRAKFRNNFNKGEEHNSKVCLQNDEGGKGKGAEGGDCKVLVNKVKD